MCLVVIGASTNIARVARSLGEELVFVQQPGSMNPRILRNDIDELYTLDYCDRSALSLFAERVLRPRDPKAVVSVTETGLEPAAILSELMGTPGTPLSVVHAIRNKLEMRRALRKHAPHLNVAYADSEDDESLKKLFSSHRDVIAKPISGTASLGVHLVHTIDEARSLPSHEQYIFEAFVPGTEFSVEAFSSDGDHGVLAIAEKGTADNFVEVSHLVPPADLNPVQTEQIRRSVQELLDALGLREGPSHTELKLHDGVAKVIETHNRPGGDGIADLVAITTGIDWRRISLGWPLGIRPVMGVPQAAAAANLFFTAAPGRVTKIVEQPSSLADVQLTNWEIDVSAGDLVGELRSSQDRLGVTTITGPSAEACRRAIETLRHDSVVITEDIVP